MVRRLLQGDDNLPPPDHSKTSWPEVVGWQELPAGIRIGYDRPEVTVEFFNVGETPPPGFDPKPVVVFVDIIILYVAEIPVLG